MGERGVPDVRDGMQEGELRALKETRERLGSEVERLKAELIEARRNRTKTRREGQSRLLQQARDLGAQRDRAANAQERADGLEREIREVRRSQMESRQAEQNAEIRQLRSELDNVLAGQRATVHGICELRRDHTAALAGLMRPGMVDGPPSGTPAELQQDYMTLSRSGLMDSRWYRNRYSDLADVEIDPVLHYLEHGWREGRRPGPAFDGTAYLVANPDVAALGVNPLVHYHRHGAAELRPLVPDSLASVVAETSTYAKATVQPTAPRLWFFVGDLIEWLTDHEHLTGVGRVTSELLFAALLDEAEEIRLCVLDPAGSGLRQLSNWEPIRDLARRTSHTFSTAELQTLATRVDLPDLRVAPGDHVIFTGVVWTEQYTILFQSLAAKAVRFSLLVHDIIPLLVAASDDGRHARVFANWLKVALELAKTIYVSNRSVAEDISRWAVAARVRPGARIARVDFGSRVFSSSALEGGAVLDHVERANFVLCVGTIDPRKNQKFLLRVWQELVIRFGPGVCPQLVLAGRNDLSLDTDPAFNFLKQLNKVELLTGLADQEISALYQACRFTAFPSMREGYGLPVAESLGNGKLCISSDLPEVRAHAGDLAWYFDPSSIADTICVFERAITSPEEVAAVSERIARDHTVRSWSSTFSEIQTSVKIASADSIQQPRGREIGAYAGSTHLSERALLSRAATWCVHTDIEVSILIVNWNAGALTMDCIRQVWAATEGLRYEIVIADNGSMESELMALRELGPGVRLIEIGCNRFFGEANNIAAEAAQGRYVCFLNNDAFVEDGWLRILRQGFNDHPQAGAVGPLFRFPDGSIQEGGGFIDAGGYPVRRGRGELELSEALLKELPVDYISAATLLVDRKLFIKIGGFDLAYEPAYYEDTDLCFKIAAAGSSVIYIPNAVVVHIEGASANGDPEAELRRKNLGDLNRGKFVARWGEYLRCRDNESLALVAQKLAFEAKSERSGTPRDGLPKTIVYTSEPLTPGGGERYLLTLAELLLKNYDVTLVTPYAYSYSRIHDIATTFGLNLSGVKTALESETLWDDADLQIVMGNYIVPPISARGRVNLFHCQFPFPMPKVPTADEREMVVGYDRIIVNSHFTALHVEASLNGFQLPDVPIVVLPPPVRQLEVGPKCGDLIRIISVGRFFRGGHSKRHDLMIKLFKALAEEAPQPVELHLVGSSHPGSEHVAYLAELMASAKSAPIHFHVNAAADDLQSLYATADIYWHATGLGSNLVAEPWAAEHFGISIVEAMSAGAVPFALASGGAREIISHGLNGFLYQTADDLLEQTLVLIAAQVELRARLADAAIVRARDFSVKAFAEKLNSVLGEFGMSL